MAFFVLTKAGLSLISRRTNLEKVLCVVSIILCFALICSIISNNTLSQKLTESDVAYYGCLIDIDMKEVLLKTNLKAGETTIASFHGDRLLEKCERESRELSERKVVSWCQRSCK